MPTEYIEVRDTRNGSWYWVNTAINACSHITYADKCIYSSLATFSGCKEIRPSFEEIAKRTASSVRQAKLSIKKLIEVELVDITKGGGRGKCNIYNLLKAAKGCKFCTVPKGCKKSIETVQNLSINRANSAPQVDKELDKEKNKEKDNIAGSTFSPALASKNGLTKDCSPMNTPPTGLPSPVA